VLFRSQTLITVFEGEVLAQNATGSLSLTDGQSAAAQLGRSPALRTVVRPRDAVQWALYYPPVLYFRPDEFPAGPGWQGMVRSSSEFYAKGDLANAFKRLENAPADIRDPRFFTYRARLALAVGRVDDATADIDRALQLAPSDANALSLQAIMAIVQNDKDRAMAIAEKNVAANPASASARMSFSGPDSESGHSWSKMPPRGPRLGLFNSSCPAEAVKSERNFWRLALTSISIHVASKGGPPGALIPARTLKRASPRFFQFSPR
jgi:tetratricopeptide (TPR) repeat protein